MLLRVVDVVRRSDRTSGLCSSVSAAVGVTLWPSIQVSVRVLFERGV